MSLPRRKIIGRPLFRKKISSAHKTLSEIDHSLDGLRQVREKMVVDAEREMKYGNEWRGHQDRAIANVVFNKDAFHLQRKKGDAVRAVDTALRERKHGVRGAMRVALASSAVRQRLKRMKKKGLL